MVFTGWDQLQPELIEAIAHCLTAYIDYVRFRAVCVSWRSAVPKFPSHLPTQIPWLMIPFFEDDESTEGQERFYSISEDKFHILELPECSDKWVGGSSLGWLLLMEMGPGLELFNPITRTLIQLPPLTAFPNVIFRPSNFKREFKILYEESNAVHSLEDMHSFFLNKMVLSSSPKTNSEDDNYTVVIIIEHGKMAFMKKGNQLWTVLQGLESYFLDVIYHKGQCFALDVKNRIVVCDFDGPSPTVTVISSGPKGKGFGYLADFSGDLLVIKKSMDDCFDNTSKFEVFKPDRSLEEEEEEWQWHEVKELVGDGVFFLGQNSAVSVLAHEFSGCQRNCIYFADVCHRDYDSEDYSDSEEFRGAYDLGVFNLKDGSIKPLFSNRVIWPPATWITPNPN